MTINKKKNVVRITAAAIIFVIILSAGLGINSVLRGSDTAPVSAEASSSLTDGTAINSTPSDTTIAVGTASAGGLDVSCRVGNSWQNNGMTCTQIDFTITNGTSSSVQGWTLETEVPDGSVLDQSWNGTYSLSGTSLKVSDSAEIAAGGSASTGFIISTPSGFTPTKININGTASDISVPETAATEQTTSQDNPQNTTSGGQTAADTVKPVIPEAILERSGEAVQGDDWLYVKGNKIVDKDGKEVWLTGCNWFGYNTGTNIFDGIWNSNLENSVSSIADHGFNVIRMPFSAELINQWANGTYPTANYNQALNPNLKNKNSLEIFDYVVELCEANGIKIIIDIHCAETNSMGHMINLWYSDKITVDQYYYSLEWMAARYKNNDTIIAYDIKNEPHGKPSEGVDKMAVWNNSTSSNNWKYTAETAAKKVLAQNPNVLILVEGTESYPKDVKKNNFTSSNMDDYYTTWWGGNLRGVKDYPINLGKYQNKLVYSPHDYGPTVYEQPWFKGNYNYDSLMKDCWYDNWFYIYDKGTAPLLVGEWGGFMREPNLTWMTYMRQLIKTNRLHHTFWCYNANSGDTGGLVKDDFTTWDTEKYNFVKEVLWQQDGKFVGLDHEIPLGNNGITLSEAK